jgi:hypothetical protein
MKSDLLKTEDLAHNQSNEPSLPERIEKLQSSCRVLERSIQIYQTVLSEFQPGSTDYAAAMNIFAGMKDSYSDRKFEAATLRLLVMFGEDKLQASQVLEAWLNQVIETVKKVQEEKKSGTAVAKDNTADNTNLPPADKKETIH